MLEADFEYAGKTRQAVHEGEPRRSGQTLGQPEQSDARRA
jgi:hypothetical protein